MRIYPYLRASTPEQDPFRAFDRMKQFAKDQGVELSAAFSENASGATLERPELFNLINLANKGDCILVEQVDRLSRLNEADWQKLKNLLRHKEINIVSQDIPTSWRLLHPEKTDSSTFGFMERIINDMLFEILANVSRKDYEDRRRRQAEGIVKAQKTGKYKGKSPNLAKHKLIRDLLNMGYSWKETMDSVGCSRGLVAGIARKLKEENKFCDQQFLFKK